MQFADELERAAHITDQANEEAIAETRRRAAPEQFQVKETREDGTVVWVWPETECRDCGEDIEAGRLEMGKVRCFRCQSLLEKRRKQYAR